MMRSLPLRATLTAAIALLVAATALVLAIGWQANRVLTERTLADLTADANELAAVYTAAGPEALAARIRTTQQSSALIAADGRLVAGAPLLAGAHVSPVFTNVKTNRLYAIRTVLLPGSPSFTLRVARDIEDQRGLALRIQLITFAGLTALGLAALAFGLYLRRALLDRVSVVSATSQAIMAGDLSQRIPRDASGDELDTLAASLNDMLGRIDDLMQALREVSDNIAHDLKTPINRLRITAEEALRDPGNADAPREALGAVIEQADGIIQTFNALLLIARLKPGVQADTLRDDIDLAAMITDVTDLYAPVAEDAHMIIRVLDAEPTPYRANRQLLGQALANLIDNAIKYSADANQPPDSARVRPIDITLSTNPNGFEITVADHGPGIAPEDRPKALQRFGRLDASRTLPGTGLGLSLVAAIARIHGGALRLEDNAPGLRAVLTLPRV